MDDNLLDKLVPETKRKTRQVRPHRTGILVPTWWRGRRALALLTASVLSVIAALVVIGSAADRVSAPSANHHASSITTKNHPVVETLDDLTGHYHEEPLPNETYEDLQAAMLPDPSTGVLHPIDDPGAGYKGEPIGALINRLGLDKTAKAKAPETSKGDTASSPSTMPETTAASESEQIAALPPATSDIGGEPVPPWLRYALPFTPVPGKPMIAIIIDDTGVSIKYSAEAIKLPGPLTISFMTYAKDLNHQADEARAHGHEIMLHIPMQPISAHIDPGPNVLKTTMDTSEILANLTWDMRRLKGFVGINNHMGSKFTQDEAGMRTVLEAISRSGHLFIDSRTTPKSVAARLAEQIGLPFASRNVFIDYKDDPATIRDQLREVERLAAKNGAVIAIGHPRPDTIAALRAWLPTVAAKGFQLVPVTAIVRARWAHRAIAQKNG